MTWKTRGPHVSRRAALAALTAAAALPLAGCSALGGGACGPGETSIRSIADRYGDYVGESVVVEGTTVDGTDPTDPTIDDTTGRALVHGTGEQRFAAGQCWVFTADVLPKHQRSDPSRGSSAPDVILEARMLERHYPHSHT